MIEEVGINEWTAQLLLKEELVGVEVDWKEWMKKE